MRLACKKKIFLLIHTDLFHPFSPGNQGANGQSGFPGLPGAKVTFTDECLRLLMFLFRVNEVKVPLLPFRAHQAMLVQRVSPVNVVDLAFLEHVCDTAELPSFAELKLLL